MSIKNLVDVSKSYTEIIAESMLKYPDGMMTTGDFAAEFPATKSFRFITLDMLSANAHLKDQVLLVCHYHRIGVDSPKVLGMKYAHYGGSY